MENPTIEDVEIEYRSFVKEAMKKLSSFFKNIGYIDTLELRIREDNLPKYMLLFWNDPYTFYIEVRTDIGITFRINDSDIGNDVLNRFVSKEAYHIKEIEFFINSLKEFLEMNDKLRKFVNKYEESDLPIGYLREEKIKQILK